MRLFLPGLLLFAILSGCGRPSAKSSSTSRSTATNQPSNFERSNRDQSSKAVSAADKNKQPAMQPDDRPSFIEKEMVPPLNGLRGYSVEDYLRLPNCLDVLNECVAVPFEGKTSEQYKDAMLQVAQKPCRVVLKVVDVSADYDYADFELLADDGKSGTAALKENGDLGNYSKHLRATFSINNVKKAKGLDSKHLSIGDRVVLVGLGYVVTASPWGAASPRHGMPQGDERRVMLRAFGKPSKYHPNEYEFSFMVRNWYIASQ